MEENTPEFGFAVISVPMVGAGLYVYVGEAGAEGEGLVIVGFAAGIDNS